MTKLGVNTEKTSKTENVSKRDKKSMLGVTLKDRKKTEDIRSTTNVEDILKKIKQLKWRWTGHMAKDSKIK